MGDSPTNCCFSRAVSSQVFVIRPRLGPSRNRLVVLRWCLVSADLFWSSAILIIAQSERGPMQVVLHWRRLGSPHVALSSRICWIWTLKWSLANLRRTFRVWRSPSICGFGSSQATLGPRRRPVLAGKVGRDLVCGCPPHPGFASQN